jgi:hypothetical protein
MGRSCAISMSEGHWHQAESDLARDRAVALVEQRAVGRVDVSSRTTLPTTDDEF